MSYDRSLAHDWCQVASTFARRFSTARRIVRHPAVATRQTKNCAPSRPNSGRLLADLFFIVSVCRISSVNNWRQVGEARRCPSKLHLPPFTPHLRLRHFCWPPSVCSARGSRARNIEKHGSFTLRNQACYGIGSGNRDAPDYSNRHFLRICSK